MRKKYFILAYLFSISLTSCSLFYPYLNIKSYVKSNNASLIGVITRFDHQLIELKDNKNEEDFLNDFSSIKRSYKDKGDKCGIDEFYVVFHSSKNDEYFGYGRRNFVIYNSFSLSNLEDIKIKEAQECYTDSINEYFKICNEYFDLPELINQCG